MSITPSAMIPIGTPMPPFTLPDTSGKMHSPSHPNTGTLIIFMCNHCPYVVHVAETLANLHTECTSMQIEMYGINSNDATQFPADSASKMIEAASEFGWNFPYLIDETQEIAKKFHASCTPDVFLYDNAGNLFYRGQLDHSRPNSGELSNGEDLLTAIGLLASGNPPPTTQIPSIGCNIKWKP